MESAFVLATYILGPVVTVLPRGWREKVFQAPGRLARAAVISGILESVLALVGLITWYSIYVTSASDAISRSGMGASESAERIGVFGYVWFWLNPLTWVIAYFGFEGAMRSLAALATGQVYGTLPVCAADYVWRLCHRLRLRHAEPELPLVADEIIAGGADCDMRIASCRDYGDWRYPYTVHYAGAYFQVVAMIHLEAGPRPYVYSLRRLPSGEIARGLCEYDPQGLLTSRKASSQR